jgi:Sec-independent protein secretion pathway component TatC
MCTIFGAFITPDGSGVTMWFIAGPMILLYIIGMLIIESKIKRRQQDQKQQYSAYYHHAMHILISVLHWYLIR